MRCTLVLLKRPLKSPKAFSSKKLDLYVNESSNYKMKKKIQKTIADLREHNWISSNDQSKTSLSRQLNEFKPLKYANSKDSLYQNNQEFRDFVDGLLFELVSNVTKVTLKYIDIVGQLELKLYHNTKAIAIKSLEEKLALSLADFKKQENIQIQHLLIPTAENLKNSLYALFNAASPNSIIEKFFSTKPEIKTPHDRAYYLLEAAFSLEAKRTQDHYVPVQEVKVDITNPAEWYSNARDIRRKLILHVGPTNSGKTYNALKRLRESNNGYFAGPLRLLAREVYDRFKAENLPCNLVTGEEIIKDLDEYGNVATLSCGTVEMIDLKTYFDVVVLDEIQMIGDLNRGWAWTNALLGVRAKEVHLCGEESVVDLIHELAKMTGDEVVVNRYKRLGKLVIEEAPLYNHFNELRKGDCIVAFSKKEILNYKADIEASTDFKCSVVYGALPAETRSTEANKFNTGKTDILVASDAIGMGLNLKIDRIIFSTHKKFNGRSKAQLEPPHVKQIAGRAGRFKVAPVKDSNSESTNDNSKSESIGYVSAFDSGTLDYIRKCLVSRTKMLSRALLWPSDEIWCNYMSEFPSNTSFATIIKAFEFEVRNSKHLKISPAEDRIRLVEVFQKFKELLIGDKLRMSIAPINVHHDESYKVLEEFSSVVAKSQSRTPTSLRSLEFERVLKKKPTGIKTIDSQLLGELEMLHKHLLVWLWMNNRYPTLFVDRESATDLKNLIEERIETILETTEIDPDRFGGKSKKTDQLAT